MKYATLLALPLALLASGTAFANETRQQQPPSDKTATTVIVLSDAEREGIKAELLKTPSRLQLDADQQQKIKRLRNFYEPFGAINLNTIKASLPDHMEMTPEEAEAEGWPCGKTAIAAVAERTFAAAKEMHHRIHSSPAGDAKIVKAMLEAAQDCSDCPDCDDCPDCAEGTCTEAGHKQARGYHCKDCPETETV